MTDKQNRPSQKEAPQTPSKEQKNIAFQPLLRISRTQTAYIGHNKTYSITHETHLYAAEQPNDKAVPLNKTKSTQEPAQNQPNEAEKQAVQDETPPDLSGQKEPHSEIGLDCSGQGECQPGIVPSDSDEMQQFLMKRRKDVNKRTNAKKQSKI